MSTEAPERAAERAELRSHRLDEMLEKEAIRECMYRYCRGVDRLDGDLIRSTYWPDAVDQHGPYRGDVEGLVAILEEVYGKMDHGVHLVGNIQIQLAGSRATVESSFQAYAAPDDTPEGLRLEEFLLGRYLDVFEKREDEWRVLQRTVVYDWIRRTPLPNGLGEPAFGMFQPPGLHAPDDPSYQLTSEV